MKFLFQATVASFAVLGRATVLAQDPVPQTEWITNIGQEIRGVLYYPTDDAIIVGGTFGGIGASVHQVDPVSGDVTSTVTLEKSEDDAGPDLPHFLGPFYALPTGTGAETIRYLLMVINDGVDATGASIGRIVSYPPGGPAFVWETKTIGLNPTATWGGTGYASDVAVNDDGKVVYICQSDGTLSAINTVNGRFFWQVVDAAVVRMSGIAFYNGDLYVTSEQLDGSGTGGLHRYDAATGAKKDSYATSVRGIKTSPTVDASNGFIYVTDAELGLLQFGISDSALEPLWTTVIEEGGSSQQTFSDAAISSDGSIVYAPAWRTVGRVTAFDGTVVWRKSFDVSIDNDLVVAADDSALYAIAQNLFKLDPTSGVVEWKWTGTKIGDAPALNSNGLNLYIGLWSGALHNLRTEIAPTASPTPAPSMEPTTVAPVVSPIPVPTAMPFTSPTVAPVPTAMPNTSPTVAPVAPPTISPTTSGAGNGVNGGWLWLVTNVAVAVGGLAFPY